MSISFNSISADIRTFGQFIEIDNSRAVQGTPAQPHVALVIGQGLAAGTVAEAVPTLIGSADAAEGFWGVGSMMAAMCSAFKKANPSTELWGISLDDGGGGVDNTFTLIPAGTATAAGEIGIYINGVRVAVAIADGDANTVVSASIDTAITAHPEYSRMPITSGEAAGTVTLTTKNAGTVGNGIDVRVNYQPNEKLPAGITAIPVVNTGTGATDPVLATAITAMGDVQYHTIVIPFTDATSLAAIEAELLTRWGPMEQKEGQVFTAALGTQSTLTSLGNTRNSQFLTIMSTGGAGGNSPTAPYLAAAIVGGISAAQTQNDPARPLQTLPLTGMLPPAEADRFTRTERNTLLTDGIATNYVDGGGVVRIERIITTYQTNPLSVSDPSYLDITTMRTLSRLRFDVRTRIALRYPRHKLASDGTLFDPGQAVVTPSSIRAELISLFRSWEGLGLVEGGVQFKEDLIVERNASDVNRVDMRMSPDLMNQFRVFAGQLQFLL